MTTSVYSIMYSETCLLRTITKPQSCIKQTFKKFPMQAMFVFNLYKHMSIPNTLAGSNVRNRVQSKQILLYLLLFLLFFFFYFESKFMVLSECSLNGMTFFNIIKYQQTRFLSIVFRMRPVNNGCTITKEQTNCSKRCLKER